jgi:uncharacterized protein YndB with AHSA1/START domain
MSASAGSTRNHTSSTAEPELLITRFFDAPRELVFQAWTDPEHLKRWGNAPVGFTVTTEKSDIRPGGEYKVCMRSPEGVDHWLQGVYTEVVPPERLSFTHTWLRADGTPGVETRVTLTFVDRGNRTELTLHQTGFDTVASRDGHDHGWNSTFDRLADYLAGLDAHSSNPQQAH